MEQNSLEIETYICSITFHLTIQVDLVICIMTGFFYIANNLVIASFISHC